MATSFLIIPPDISTAALSVTANKAFDQDHALSNLLSGGRGVSRLAANSTSFTVTFDLGTGNSRKLDHLVIGNCKGWLAQSVTDAVAYGSNDGVNWQLQLGLSGTAFGGLDGPNGADFIATPAYNNNIGATLAPYRYFKFFASGGSYTYPSSKLYLGAALDMGKEPDDYDMEIADDQDADTWRYTRGQVVMTKAFHPRRRYTIEWDGVTDEKAGEFEERVLYNPRKDSVFLHAATWTDPLYGQKLVHCEVLDAECSVSRKRRDWADIKAVFLEIV